MTKYEVTAVDKVIDTTAAGDSFSAGYLIARMNNKTIAEAILAGQNISSQVVSKQGAIVDIDYC